MARKGWDALSPGYRSRIEKAGLTRADYEAGTALTRARGHAKTPEHPHSYDPKKYPQYAGERTRLTKQLHDRKERLFGGRPRWNAERSDRIIREKPPSMANLRWALNADEDDLLDAIREDPEAYRFLMYH